MTNFIEPNEYDLEVVNNGCGSSSMKSVIGTTDFFNFIFALACMWHDFWYSKYSSVTRKQADDMFYELMMKLIKEGGYPWYKRWGYTLIAKDYWRLVRWYGKSSYSSYEIGAVLPSFKPLKNKKIKKLNLYAFFHRLEDRWYLISEKVPTHGEVVI